MLPKADLTGTRPLTAIAPATPATAASDARQEVFSRLTQIAMGKTLQADVLSRLDDRTFMVRIANTTVRASLPSGAQVGQSLSVRLMTADPRPTFLLLTAGETETTSLSNAGRLIDRLLSSAGERNATGTVLGQTALLGAAVDAADATQVAAALRTALALSGVFYESHLRQWVNGERALSLILQEPQAQLQQGEQAGAQAGTNTAASNAAARIAAAQAIDIVDAWVDGAEAGVGAGAAAASSQPGVTTDSHLLQLMHAQLRTLENNRVAWHGELWPGQKMEWEIGEDPPQHEEPGLERTPPGWTSVMRFDLPVLGSISATVRLSGEHVAVQLRTDSDQATLALRARGGELAGALEAAGSPLDLLTVQHDG